MEGTARQARYIAGNGSRTSSLGSVRRMAWLLFQQRARCGDQMKQKPVPYSDSPLGPSLEFAAFKRRSEGFAVCRERSGLSQGKPKVQDREAGDPEVFGESEGIPELKYRRDQKRANHESKLERA